VGTAASGGAGGTSAWRAALRREALYLTEMPDWVADALKELFGVCYEVDAPYNLPNQKKKQSGGDRRTPNIDKIQRRTLSISPVSQ
jgi:hypothetical protein